MNTHNQRTHWTTSTLLFAAVAAYLAGPLTAPARLQDLYELDTISEKYAAVAAEIAAYRWANIAAAAAAVLAAVGLLRFTHTSRRDPNTGRRAAMVWSFAAGGWVVLCLLRVAFVAGRASDVATGDANHNSFADAVLEGDGVFILLSLLAAAALVWLAVDWRRSQRFGWPTILLIGLGGVTTGLLVRSDPLSITFIPPFPFFLALLPLAINAQRGRRDQTSAPVTAAAGG
ncbi:MAG TPA: hypothetical protein VM121_08970 [Acidimicrobiales bacterium]|nr:hypothetical protein [Acidimicrobiales bacterium]